MRNEKSAVRKQIPDSTFFILSFRKLKAKEIVSVLIADIVHHLADRLDIVRIFATLDKTAEIIAENAAEVFMACIG